MTDETGSKLQEDLKFDTIRSKTLPRQSRLFKNNDSLPRSRLPVSLKLWLMHIYSSRLSQQLEHVPKPVMKKDARPLYIYKSKSQSNNVRGTYNDKVCEKE